MSAAVIALSAISLDNAHARAQAVEPAATAAAPQAPPGAAQPSAASPTAQPAAPPVEAAHGAAQPPAPAGDHAAAPAAAAPEHAQPGAHAPPAQGEHAAGGAGHGGGEHPESIWPTIARLVNFLILAGGLYYFLAAPISQYLANRSQQIRAGLISARETTERATAQIAELDKRLESLPNDLLALRRKGVEEIAAEERRIHGLAEAEKQRLIDDVHRDIDVRTRVARKQLTEHAADLAVQLAAERVRETITDADQARLVDRYAAQVKDIHG